MNKKLLSEKAWKAITTPATFEQSIVFNSVSGWLSSRDFGYGNLGWSYYLYLDWDAMQLSINDEQLEYMMNAKEAICLAYAYEHELFILTEGNRSIGLVAFSLDSTNEKYYIESVLIDKKYQQRGFGKIMMSKGIDHLKSLGCKHLSIGVNRFNIAAQELYKSVGFIEKTVYEDFIELETYFD